MMTTVDKIRAEGRSNRRPLKKRPVKEEFAITSEIPSENPLIVRHHLNNEDEIVKLTVDSRVENVKIETKPIKIFDRQKFWHIASLHATFYPFHQHLYSSIRQQQQHYFPPIRLSCVSSSLSPSPDIVTSAEAETDHHKISITKLSSLGKATEDDNGDGQSRAHQTLLPLSPTPKHITAPLTSQSQSSSTTSTMTVTETKLPRIMTSAKMLTDFKISTLLKLASTTSDIASKSGSGSIASTTRKIDFTSTKKTVNRHICNKCQKTYSTFSGLSKHQQFYCTFNDTKRAPKCYACERCGKVYASSGALKMHIRTHTLPCKCHLCGKAFSRPWLLQGHIRTHTGEKPFSCNHCHRAFADRSNLRAHLQTHSDVKKYSCTTCSKTFSRMSLLTKHNDSGCPGIQMPQPAQPEGFGSQLVAGNNIQVY